MSKKKKKIVSFVDQFSYIYPCLILYMLITKSISFSHEVTFNLFFGLWQFGLDSGDERVGCD
jgi:hypothetical protein